jgi:CheY-like chemotaxis protein
MTEMSQSDLAHQVRTALTNLYDYAYLQNHPLAALVDAAGTLDQVTRAQKLRRLLIDCIESLQPRNGQVSSDAARAHAMLIHRYVDGVSIQQIAERRGLSERQAYREVRKGVEAVASVLQDRLKLSETQPAPGSDVEQQGSEDLLRMARAEAERLGGRQRSAIPLGEVLQEVVSLLEPVARQKGIALAAVAPASWPKVVADRTMMRQALVSLASHALRIGRGGRLTLDRAPGVGGTHIEIRRAPDAAVVAETDGTPGGPPEVSLAVAAALLEDQGCSFEIAQTERVWQASVALPKPDWPTILAVDDNQELLKLLQRYLSAYALTVVGAAEGQEALRLARELHPSLITLDVMIPQVDGWELLRALKSSPETQDIPVVVCSILQESDLARSLGASDYLSKPVAQEELVEMLTRWLGPLQPAL